MHFDDPGKVNVNFQGVMLAAVWGNLPHIVISGILR